jgi:hypothetical protein
MKFDERTFNFDPYLFRLEEKFDYKTLREKFPENFEAIDEWFKRRDRKYIKITFIVQDILNNSFKKAVIRKYYEDNDM